MNNNFEKDYKDITRSLSSLKNIQPKAEYTDYFTQRVQSTTTPMTTHTSSLFSLRLAALMAIVLLLTSTGIVVASSRSQEGDLLYPVKKAVNNLESQLINSHQNNSKSTNKPIPTPTTQPTPTQAAETSIPTQIATPTPTPTIIITPTTQAPPSTPSQQQTNTDLNLNAGVAEINLNSQSTSDGSEDSKRADTSLLPDLNINLPKINLGL